MGLYFRFYCKKCYKIWNKKRIEKKFDKKAVVILGARELENIEVQRTKSGKFIG